MSAIRVGAVALAALGVFTSAPAQACACSDPTGDLVATGVSPAGERWLTTATRSGRRGVVFETSIRGQSEMGGFVGIGARRLLGGCRAVLGTATYTSGWVQVDGPVDRSVRRLDVLLKDGRSVTVTPQLARARARRTNPRLRGFRWASTFLPRGVDAIGATAFDHRGRKVTRLREHLGLFLCPGEPDPLAD